MAYVPNAESDIFISYPLEAQAWAQEFETYLKREMDQWVGKVTIYFAGRDWRLAPADEMLRQAARAAFFISTLVPSALEGDDAVGFGAQDANSKKDSVEGGEVDGDSAEDGDLKGDNRLRFFRREWRAFRKTESLFGPTGTRFAPLAVKPIPDERFTKFFPAPGADAFHRLYKFYVEDGLGYAHTLGPGYQPTEFSAEVSRFAQDVAKRLKKIRADAEARNIPPGPDTTPAKNEALRGGFDGMKVLLGEKGDLGEEWEEIRQLLKNDGVDVLNDNPEVSPDGQFPRDSAKLEGVFTAALRQADLFVQLLDPQDEARLRKEVQPNAAAAPVISRAQRMSGWAQAHLKDQAILQWRDPKLKKDAMAFWPVELLDGKYVQAVGLNQFKLAVRTRLKELRVPPAPPPPPGQRPLLFIMADRPDLSLARTLLDAIVDCADVDVMTGVERKRKQQFVDDMKLAKSVIMIHGNAKLEFVNNWLSMYVREKARLKRNARFDRYYLAPPPKGGGETPHIPTSELKVLDCQTSLMLDGIKQLCRELLSAG